MTAATSTPIVRHARLTRSQIRARISPTARLILTAISYLLKVNVERPLSHRTIARQARVSEGSVSRLMPVLAAERGNISGNRIPFVRRRWCEDSRGYLITLLEAPEVRGWYEAPVEEVAHPEAAGATFEAPVILADQLDFLAVLCLPATPQGGSMIDPPIQIATQAIATPETGANRGSIIDPPHPLSMHDHELASEPVAIAPAGQPNTAKRQSGKATNQQLPDQPARTPTPQVPAAPPAPAAGDVRVTGLAERGVYAGLAYRVLVARPELTLAEFDRLAGIVARRGKTRLAPAVIVASVLARGEQVDEATPMGYRAGGSAPPVPAGERVSDREITMAAIDPRDRQLWQARFRAAETPEAKRRVLERFRCECLGGPAAPARSA